MTLVSDTIYQLKHQEGKPATFKKVGALSTDVVTGVESKEETEIIIRKAIKLENYFRQALIKILGGEKAGYQQTGDFEILIDKKDLRGQSISENDTVETAFGNGTVIKMQEFDSAYIYSIKIV